MTLSPFLGGSIAAQERMADARREAERRRLTRSVDTSQPVRRGWLRQLLAWLGGRRLRSQRRGDGEIGYRPSQPPIQSVKS